jgi:hypothetical protein
MACVNPNSPEFKKILESEPNPLIAELIYNKKYGQLNEQSLNEEGLVFKETQVDLESEFNFLNVSDQWAYKKTDSVTEIDNYTLDQLIKKQGKPENSEELEKFNQVSNALGELEAYRDYFENDNIVRPSSVIQEKIDARVTEAFESFADVISEPDIMQESMETPEDYLDFVGSKFKDIIKSDNEKTALELAMTLSDKLNIPYEVISNERMREMFPNQPFRKNFYRGGKVYLVEGSIDATSVFHEFAHPLIKSLSKQNPSLFKSLFDELLTTSVGQTIIINLNQDSYYTPGTTEYMEEAIVQALEAINGDTNVAVEPKVKSWIQKLLFNIKQFLRGNFGRKINVSKLNSKTTLSNFVDMINYGKEFNLDAEFLNQDLFAMFKTDYEAMQSELKELAKPDVQKAMNVWFGITKNQLSRFQADNSIFKKIEKDLADTNREGLLQQVEALMQGIVTIGNRQLVVPLDKLQLEGDTRLEKDALEFVQRIKAFTDAIFITDKTFDKYIDKLQELEKITEFNTDEFDQVFAIMQFADVWLEQINKWKTKDLFVSNTNGAFIEALNDLEIKLNNAKNIANRLSSDKVIDVLYDTLTEQMEPVKADFLEQMATMKSIGNLTMYNKLHQEYYGISVEQMLRKNQIESISESQRTLAEVTELAQLTFISYEGHDISKEQLKAYSAGVLSDASTLNGLMESYMNSQDKIVGGFAVFLQNTFSTIDANANARRSELYNGLDQLMKDAGYGDLKTRFATEGTIGRDLSSISNSFEIDSETGKVLEYKEYVFKSNFKDYHYDLQVLNQNLLDAKKEYNFNANKQNEDGYNKAKEALEKFHVDYMHRDYDPRYYEVQQKYLSDELGIKSREAQNEIFSRMRILEDNIEIKIKNKSSQMDLLWDEYAQLSSIYDLDGQTKTGDAFSIAERLIEYRDEIQEFYEWQHKEGVFDHAFETFISTIEAPKDSKVWNEEIRSWLLMNTQVATKQEYYDIRTQLIEKRSEILAELQKANDENLDVGPLYEKVFAVIKSTRDEFNQYNGNKLNAKSQLEVKKTMQQISLIKDQWVLASGITKDELRRYRNIENFTLNNQGQFLSDDDRIFYQQFWDIAAVSLKERFGISKEDVEFVKEINKYLSEMSESGLTQHYINTFTKFALATEEGAKLFHDKNKAVDIEAGDLPLPTELFDIAQNIDFINELKEVNSEFAEWFDRNHYVEAIDVYGINGEFIEEKNVYKATPVWSYSNPRDVKNYEALNASENMPTEFSSNGYIEIDGIPRVPTRAYQRRNVKEQYQTKKILEDYVDDKGNLILANRDNKGVWLPKDYNPSQPGSAKDNKYIDASYKAMFNDNRGKWNLLNHIKKAHLNNQKELDASQKLYLSYPRYRKGRLETYDKNWWARKKLRWKDTFRVAVDDYDEGFYSGAATFDQEGYNTFRRPIGGSFGIPIIDVSTNIIESVMNHAHSIEQFKAMRKVNSFSNILSRNLDYMSTSDNAIPELNVMAIAKNQQLVTNRKNAGEKRAAAVENMINKHLRGRNLRTWNTDQTQGAGLNELVFSKLIGIGAQRMAFMSFALDPIKSVTNYVGGKLMTWKKGAEGRWYNGNDLRFTRVKSAAVITEMVTLQFSNKQPSAILQFMDITGAVPSGLKKTIGGRAGATAAQKVAEGKFWYADRSYLNDSTVVHQFLAILEHARFDLNGKSVSLVDAIELRDGKLYTKEGVPENMSITYNKKGEAVLGSKLKNIMNAHQGFLQKNIGVASEYTEPEAYRHVIGKFVLFLVKFFPGMAIDKYQFRSKKGKRFNKRLNLQTQQAEIGTYTGMFSALRELWSGTYNPKNMSWQSRKAVLGTLIAVLSQYVLRQTQMMIWFNLQGGEDGEDEEAIYYNPDDDSYYNMNTILKRSTSAPDLPFVSDRYTINSGIAYNWQNYARMSALRTLLRVENEERTFNPEQALFTGMGIASLQSPLADGGGIKEMWSLITEISNITADDEDALVYTPAGPYVWQEKDRYKIWNVFGRIVGFKGDLLMPKDVLKREKRYFREGYVDRAIRVIPDLPWVDRLVQATDEERILEGLRTEEEAAEAIRKIIEGQ